MNIKHQLVPLAALLFLTGNIFGVCNPDIEAGLDSPNRLIFMQTELAKGTDINELGACMEKRIGLWEIGTIMLKREENRP